MLNSRRTLSLLLLLTLGCGPTSKHLTTSEAAVADPASCSSSTWSTLYTDTSTAGVLQAQGKIMVDSNSDIWFSFNEIDASGNAAGVIKRSKDGGVTFAAEAPHTVDSGSTGMTIRFVGEQSSGTVFVAGDEDLSSGAGKMWVSQGTRDASTGDYTWTTVISESGASSTKQNRITAGAIAPNGDLWIGAQVTNSGDGNSPWSIRRLKVGESTTTVVDTYLDSTYGAYCRPTGIDFTDDGGTVYVTGFCATSYDGASGTDAVVTRKGAIASDDTVTFESTAVDVYKNDSYAFNRGQDIEIDASGNVYVSVLLFNDDSTFLAQPGPMTVRRFDVSTSSWTNIDSYEFSTGQGGGSYGLVRDTAGSIFVVGQANESIPSSTATSTAAYFSSFNSYHVVRKSANGTTWALSDIHEPSTGVRTTGFDGTINSNGQLLIIGSAYDSNSNPFVFIRLLSCVAVCS